VSRRDWLTAAVITVVAVAIAAFLLRDGGDDPAPRSHETEEPSARVMSEAAASDLIDGLTGRGWVCYDSLRDPVIKRCFFDRVVGDGGTLSADVALTYADDYVARVNIYAAGERDGGEHVRLAEQTARLAGDVLLDGAGDALADRVGVRQPIELAGRQVFGNRATGASTQVVVESASYDEPTLPPPNLSVPDVLVRAAEAGGLACQASGSTTTCSGAGQPDMTITLSVAAGRVGSLSISASNYAVPDDPAVVNRIAGYVFEAGIGGPRASAWIRSHADSPTQVRADLGGVHFRLGGGGDRVLYLSLGAIQN
jgi:hypothetical protein